MSDDAIRYLEAELARMRSSAVPNELGDMDPDHVFELGYESVIFDLRHMNDPVRKDLDHG